MPGRTHGQDPPGILGILELKGIGAIKGQRTAGKVAQLLGLGPKTQASIQENLA